jgi:hypothetical protein
MADLVTRLIKGVELMRAGTWQGHGCPVDGCTFTTDDIDEMVEAYVAAGDTFSAPVKLGHDGKQKLLQKDGYPAAGWVINLRREGDALVGDLEKVPAKVADLMKAGGYRKRSSEMRPDVEFGGKTFKYGFTGLALLGADLPAVEGLNDIMGLYLSLNLSAADSDLVVFSSGKDDEVLDSEDEDNIESIIADLEKVVERADRHIAGRRGAPRLRSLVATAKEELRRVGGKRMSRKDTENMDGKALRELLGLAEDATDEEVLAKLKTAKFGDVENSETSEADKKELSDLRARVLTLETGTATKTAGEKVDEAIKLGKLLPAQKDFALNFALKDEAGFDKFIESQPKVIALGERGSAGDGPDQVDLTSLEPTATDIAIAKQFGKYEDPTAFRLKFMKDKAGEKGIVLPADFGSAKA